MFPSPASLLRRLRSRQRRSKHFSQKICTPPTSLTGWGRVYPAQTVRSPESICQREEPSEWMALLFVSCEHYGSTDSSKICGNTPPAKLAPCRPGNCFVCLTKPSGAMRRRCASHRIAGRSNHRFIAGSVLQKEMPSEWMASLFGAGYGNRTRLCGLGSDRSTDELTLHIKLLEQGTGILRRLRRLRVPAHFLLALPKAAMPCIAPSYDGKMLVIEPAFHGLEDTAFCR